MAIKPRGWMLGLFILVPLIPLLLFWIFPLIVSIWLSFTNWDFIRSSFDYVGFKNYSRLFQDSEFQAAIWRTIYFTFFSVVPIIVLGFLTALILMNIKIGRKIVRGLIFSPWITPMIGMSIVWSWLFNSQVGPINRVLSSLGIPAPNWLADSQYAIWVVIIVTVWKNIGWASLFYADALAKIPKSLIEVSDTEGLSTWQRTRYVLAPLVMPTTLFLIIISSLDCLQAYDQITVLTQGGPAGSTRTLLYLYYELGFSRFDMGEATALSIVLLVVTAGLSFLFIRCTKNLSF